MSNRSFEHSYYALLYHADNDGAYAHLSSTLPFVFFVDQCPPETDSAVIKPFHAQLS